jgi:hypothetical protein
MTRANIHLDLEMVSKYIRQNIFIPSNPINKAMARNTKKRMNVPTNPFRGKEVIKMSFLANNELLNPKNILTLLGPL